VQREADLENRIKNLEAKNSELITALAKLESLFKNQVLESRKIIEAEQKRKINQALEKAHGASDPFATPRKERNDALKKRENGIV
jgi:hypothetical protein